MLHIKGDYVCCSHMEYCHFIYYFKAWNTAVRKQCTHAHRPEQRFKCLLLTYTLGFHHLGCQRLMRHHLIGQNDPGWNYGCHQNRRLPYSPLSMCDVEEIKLVWVDDSTKKRLIGWRGNSHTPRQTERKCLCYLTYMEMGILEGCCWTKRNMSKNWLKKVFRANNFWNEVNASCTKHHKTTG